jgi:hypothetical protein
LIVRMLRREGQAQACRSRLNRRRTDGDC